MKKSLAALPVLALAAIFSSAQETPPAAQDEEALVKAALESLPSIYETRTRVFTILSEDLAQMRRVAAIAKKLEGHLSSVLGWKLVADGAKLSVWVAPDTDAGILFETGRDFRRNATCTFRADTTRLNDYSIALGLAQSVLWQYGSDFKLEFKDTQAPLWAASALATETAIAHNSGRLLLLRQRSEKNAPIPFEKLVEPRCQNRVNQVPDDSFQVNAFWFYRSLRKRELASWQNFPNYFRGILKNAADAFPQKKDTAEKSLDLVWATAFFSTIDKTPAGTESLADSQARFEKSNRFHIQIGETEKIVSAESLIEYRHSLDIKKIAYIRLREINEALSSTNPVWHNAFVELGVFLEMIVHREDTSGELKEGSSIWAPERGTRDKIESSALRTQWQKVEAAREDAARLHAEIRALMEAPGGESLKAEGKL